MRLAIRVLLTPEPTLSINWKDSTTTLKRHALEIARRRGIYLPQWRLFPRISQPPLSTRCSPSASLLTAALSPPPPHSQSLAPHGCVTLSFSLSEEGLFIQAGPSTPRSLFSFLPFKKKPPSWHPKRRDVKRRFIKRRPHRRRLRL